MNMRSLCRVGTLLCLGLFAVACGRSELDLGAADNLPVTTGGAGTTGAGTGAAGVTGAAGRTTTGAAGAQITTGTAGTTGAAGTSGAAGTHATTGAAGATGSAGAIGTGSAGAGVPPSNEIPCGAMTCFAGMEACCVQLVNGQASATCIAADQTCASGASFSCSTTSQCAAGDVCCASAASLSTSCEAPVRCLATGVILCSADSDCPGFAPNCCGQGNLRLCRARACAGRGGGNGPAGGNGGGRGPGAGAPAPPPAGG